MDSDSGVITWEDVEAVCKLIGPETVHIRCLDNDTYAVFRFGGIATIFTDPVAALEFISAEEHPIERYVKLHGTKP